MADSKRPVTNVTDSVREYYDSQGWKYLYDEEKGLFSMLMEFSAEEIDACEVHTVVRDEERFTTFVTLPFKIPEKKRGLCATYLSHVNYKLLQGCFEMDFRDGEVQYKSTCFCGNIRLEPLYIKQYIDVGICMTETYGPGLVAVLFKDRTIDDVLERVARLRDYHSGQENNL